MSLFRHDTMDLQFESTMLPSPTDSPPQNILQEVGGSPSTAENLNDTVSAEIVDSKGQVKSELPKSLICIENQNICSSQTFGGSPLSEIMLSSSCLSEKILPLDENSAHLRSETAAILSFDTLEQNQSIDETVIFKLPDPVLPPAEDAQAEVTRPICSSRGCPLEVDEIGPFLGIRTASLSDMRELMYVPGSSLTTNDPASPNDVYVPLSQTKNGPTDVLKESKGKFPEIAPVDPLAAEKIRHTETSIVTVPASIETECSSVEEPTTHNGAQVVEIASIIRPEHSNSTLQLSCETHQPTFASNLPVNSSAAAASPLNIENGVEIIPHNDVSLVEHPAPSFSHSSALSLSFLVDEIRHPNLAPSLPVKPYGDREDHTSLDGYNSIRKITAERDASVLEIPPLSCLGSSSSTPPNSLELCQSTPAPSLSVKSHVENISEATTVPVNQIDFVPESHCTLPNPSVSTPMSSLEISQQTLGPSIPIILEAAPPTTAKRGHDNNSEVDSLGQFDTPSKLKKRPRIYPEPPAPIGTAAVSQKLAHTKLARPFRSPLLQKHSKSPNTEVARHTPLKCEGYNSLKSTTPRPRGLVGSVITPKPKQLTRLYGDTHLPPHTPNSGSKSSKAVSRPFKSPFKSPLSSLSSSTTRLVTSPNVQVLERKLQLLRRAVRIRADRDEEKLQQLTAKWRSVGREVAWEMWAIVREQGENNGWGTEENDKKLGFGNKTRGWGWDDTNVKPKATWSSLEGNWGFAECDNDQAHFKKESMHRSGMEYMELDFDIRTATTCDSERHETEKSPSMQEVEPYDEDASREIQDGNEDDRSKERQNTLGTMLREFGIADETLGWDEDEEDFIEVG